MAFYSNSRLTGYRQCPRKFLWRYVWNVDPGVEGVEAFTGKRVHESLEELYKAVLRGSETPALSQVLDRFQELWGRFWSDSIRIVADRSPDHYRRVGGACLKRYYRRHQPFRAGTTLAVEHRFEVPLDGESSHRIRGIFDRVDIGPDGGVEVHDYKTGKRTPTLGDLGGDLQVGLYELAARHLYPERRGVTMIWHYLRSGVEHRLAARSPEALSSLRRGTRRQIQAIEEEGDAYRRDLDPEGLRELAAAGRAQICSVPATARRETRFFPARVGPLCRWCSFLDWCPEGSRHAGRAFRPPPPPQLPAPPPALPVDERQERLF